MSLCNTSCRERQTLCELLAARLGLNANRPRLGALGSARLRVDVVSPRLLTTLALGWNWSKQRFHPGRYVSLGSRCPSADARRARPRIGPG